MLIGALARQTAIGTQHTSTAANLHLRVAVRSNLTGVLPRRSRRFIFCIYIACQRGNLWTRCLKSENASVTMGVVNLHFALVLRASLAQLE